MRRGDLVVVALQGEHGKPRPALVVQSDLFEQLPTVTVLPLTSQPIDGPARVTIAPSAANGLQAASQIMVHRPDHHPQQGQSGDRPGRRRHHARGQPPLAVFPGIGMIRSRTAATNGRLRPAPLAGLPMHSPGSGALPTRLDRRKAMTRPIGVSAGEGCE